MTKAEEIYHRFVHYEWNEIEEGMKKSILDAINEALRQPLVISSVCTCTKFRETPMINGKYICSICNKPIVQTDL